MDIDPARVEVINDGRSPIVERGLDALISDAVAKGHLHATLDATAAVRDTDASYVCVGTPSNPDGSVGLAHVVDVCGIIGRAIAAKSGYHSVIIRSTIVPGTMEEVCIPALEAASGLQAGVDFGVGYYPEFLRESTAIEDYRNPGLIVFGALDQPTFALLGLLNKDMPCLPHEVDLRTAEMVKYASNSWRAVKVTHRRRDDNRGVGRMNRSVGIAMKHDPPCRMRCLPAVVFGKRSARIHRRHRRQHIPCRAARHPGMDTCRGKDIRIDIDQDRRHRAACRQTRHEDRVPVETEPLNHAAGKCRQRRRFPAATNLIARLEPVPAARRVLTRCLDRIDDDQTMPVGLGVHVRAGCEIIGALAATMQHHNKALRPLRDPRRNIKAIRARTFGGPVGPGQVLRSLWNDRHAFRTGPR